MFNVFESLQGRLVILISLVALPGFLLLWVETGDDRRLALENAKEEALHNLEILQYHETELISQTERYLKRLASFAPTHSPGSVQCTTLLRQALELTDTYYNLGIPRPDGELLCNALPLKSRVNVADRPYIQAAIKTRNFSIGQYQVDRAAGVSSVNFAYPVIDPQNDELVGIAVAVVSLDWWSDRLSEIRLPANALAYITDSAGRIIAMYPKDRNLIGEKESSLNLTSVGVEVLHDNLASIMIDKDGITRIFSRRGFSGSGMPNTLSFNIGIPIAKELAEIDRQYLRNNTVLLAIFIVILGLAIAFARVGVLRPIKRFAENVLQSDASGIPIVVAERGVKEIVEISELLAENINKRLFAEQELLREKERFELAMTGANDGLFDWNLRDNSIYLSPRWKSMLGYEEEELANDFSTWENLLDKDDREKSWDMLTDYINGKRDDFSIEFRMRHKNGHWIDILSRAFLVRDDEGQAIRLVGTHTDISERKRQEEALEQAKNIAEEETRIKTSFLAAASHDLRQPLQAIRLFCAGLNASLKKYDNPRPEDLQSLDLVGRAVDSLGDLLGKLLDLSKLESGVIRPSPKGFALHEALDRVKINFEMKAKMKGLGFKVLNCRGMVYTDKVLLEQVLSNLISNAIRYTSEGRIIIGCRRDGESIRIEVWDTGIGIAKKDQQDIFLEYYQLEVPQDMANTGLGIGLAISRRICDLLDLKLEVRSRPGKGSVFSVTIPRVDSFVRTGPLRQPDREDSSVAGLDFNNNCSLLVVDDDYLALEGMVKLLETWGARVLKARSANEAISRLSTGGFVPDAMIIDYQLNGKFSGLQLCREIQGLLGTRIPAILVTGTMDPDHVRKLAQSDCVYLLKPVKPELLRKHLLNCCRH